jgi:DNA mismatch endonuclease (patch repair protein)
MDTISRKRRSWNMSRIHSKNTKPELLIRKALSKLGYKYRLNYKTYGHPDIAFPKHKIAIFIHGCFWHQHGCSNSVIPKTNRRFWRMKMRSNIQRDKMTIKMLKMNKWRVITIWECEVEKDLDGITRKLNMLLKKTIK